MPGQKATRDSRRAQILRAGYHVAARVGIGRLTVRLVASKARLSSGLVLFYFKTKGQLVTAVLGHMLKTSKVGHVTKDIARIKSPLTRLRSLIRRETIRLTNEPRHVQLLIEYWVKGFRDPLIRTRMRAEFRRYREVFRPTVQAVLASEPNRFRHVDPDGLAAVAVGVIKGGAVQSVIDPGHFDVDEYLTAANGLLEQSVKRAP
jgi:AcrR family transcriptional regulator